MGEKERERGKQTAEKEIVCVCVFVCVRERKTEIAIKKNIDFVRKKRFTFKSNKVTKNRVNEKA